MNSTGGYFELELRKGKEFHPYAIALNTGRNALELILKLKKYKKVHVPYYTCDVILEPLKKTKTLYEFYSVDKNFEPIFDYSILKREDGFLYINYFGLKDIFICEIAKKCNNLIIDNSQAFFSEPTANIPTFYSCRKFFGVPDGAYLYIDGADDIAFPIDHSESRFTHLIKRIDYGAETGFNDFKNNENNMIGQPIKKMSKLTQALLCNIDYKSVSKKRRENFLFLHKQLSNYNEIEIDFCKELVPMVYPFLSNQSDLKQNLLKHKIFIATYWQNVSEWTNKDSLEYKYAQQIIHLPIDQRYNFENLKEIINLILK
ncbi:MAG: hypothetical protein WC223_00815 [Bacteroidales bacterium]|jgi:hypothetical protein